MTDPIWVPLAAVLAIHDRQITRHGGAPGLRDRAALEMGCARAMNLAAYTDASLAEIAAAYAFGISKAHAFVDGNKRTAFGRPSRFCGSTAARSGRRRSKV